MKSYAVLRRAARWQGKTLHASQDAPTPAACSTASSPITLMPTPTPPQGYSPPDAGAVLGRQQPDHADADTHPAAGLQPAPQQK